MIICKNPECKKEFTQNPHYRAGKQRFCSEKCRIKFFSKQLYSIRKQENDMKIPIMIREKLQRLADGQQDLSGFYKMKVSCEVCGKSDNLIIHHLSYNPIIIVTMCRSCHSLLHLKFLKGKKVHP